ncbi:MAG: MFS transporter [Chloroflexota bacterium]
MFRSVKILTAAAFLSFFVFGFVDNLKGPILPELLRDLALSYSQGGTIILGAYIGFIVATLLTGIMADLVSNRGVLLVAGLCLCVGIVGFSMATSYIWLILFMGFIGLGMGSIEVGGNGLIVELHDKERGRYLNLLATFHGIGSLLVPLYVAWLISSGMPWQRIYLSGVLLAGLLTAIFLLSRSEQQQSGQQQSGQQKSEQSHSDWDWEVVRRVGFTPEMGWFYILIGAYVAVELGIAAWLVEYLQQARGMAVGESSFYLSGFFVMIMVGRLLGSFVVERIGYLNVIGGALGGGVLCLAAGIFGPKALTLALPFSGLFFSIIFPTVTAAVSERHQTNIGSVLGLLFTFGGLGGAAGPWLVGVVSDWQGIQIGLGATLLFCILALVALVVLMRRGKMEDRA